METLIAQRISAAGRRGSSRPLIVETSAGSRLVKLRGAGQGAGALVAEVIVAELAEALGLSVPPRSLVVLPEIIETADWDDELADLLAASVGINLGFDYLNSAQDFTPADVDRVPAGTRATILWLDRLVANLDRSAQNTNLMWWSDHLWLIDHGASLGFQYNWEQVSESAPREPRLSRDAHLFESVVTIEELAAADEALSPLVTRGVLTAAVDAVDDSFLMPLVPASDATALETAILRRRAAYVAYLWKRLTTPRPFLELRRGMPERVRGGPPRGRSILP